MDTTEIIKLYTQDRWSLRKIAENFGTDHHHIKRILVNNNIKVTRRNSLKEFSGEHKKNISEGRKKLFAEGYISYNTGLKTIDRVCKDGTPGKVLLYKNMLSHLRVGKEIELSWLMSFEDFDKLKFLNLSITRNRDFGNYSTDFYVNYITRFYYEDRFNLLYLNWLESGKDYYMTPSPDHIVPKSLGGKLDDLDNIQFLTWFENRCKNNIPQDRWNEMKQNINKYFI